MRSQTSQYLGVDTQSIAMVLGQRGRAYELTLSAMPRPSSSKLMASPAPQDELTPAVFDAVQTMSAGQKASLLLNTSLAMIQAGQCVTYFLVEIFGG